MFLEYYKESLFTIFFTRIKYNMYKDYVLIREKNIRLRFFLYYFVKKS